MRPEKKPTKNQMVRARCRELLDAVAEQLAEAREARAAADADRPTAAESEAARDNPSVRALERFLKDQGLLDETTH